MPSKISLVGETSIDAMVRHVAAEITENKCGFAVGPGERGNFALVVGNVHEHIKSTDRGAIIALGLTPSQLIALRARLTELINQHGRN